MKNPPKISAVSYLKNISQLRSVYDNIETQIRSVDNLNVTPETYGSLLMRVLQSKLPSFLHRLHLHQMIKSKRTLTFHVCFALKIIKLKDFCRLHVETRENY